MRLTASVLGVVGVALAFASLLLPWVVIEFAEMTFEHPLTDFDIYLGSTDEVGRFAYSTALYIFVIGLVVSIYSLLGGFITLAGTCTFALGGLLSRDLTWAFGESDGVTASPGIGLYLALAASLIIIVAIKYPVDLVSGKGEPRPRFRTWRLSRK